MLFLLSAKSFAVCGLFYISAAGFGMRPEMKLREVAARHNIEVKFDEFAGKVTISFCMYDTPGFA